jgi:hypothetical protein
LGVSAVNRTDFKNLAEMRLEDAKTLLDKSRWAAAYYLAGYAVECALKACIIVRLKNSEDWPEPGFTNQCYTHSPESLLKLADLIRARDDEAKAEVAFDSNWLVVKDWKEESRYEHSITEAKARRMYEAIAESKHGVLPWLKKRW